MVRTSTYAVALLGSAVAMTAAQRTQEELDKINAVSSCINKCFFKTFPPGSCTNDPACTCNQEKMRNDYTCCRAKECVNINEVSMDQILESIERTWQACQPTEHNRPFEKVDPEKLCGVTLKVSSSSTAASISTNATTSGSSRAAAPTGMGPSGTAASAGTTTTSASSASSPTSTGAASAARGNLVLPGFATFITIFGLALW